MIIETWHKWQPLDNMSQKYNLDSVIDDIEIFKVFLTDKDNSTIKVCFDFSVSAVHFQQKTLISFRKNTISMIKKEYGDAFLDNWTFFKITNSLSIDWMSEQSIGLMKFEEFQHFVFVTTNYFLEIVAFKDPKVYCDFLDAHK